MELKKYLDQSEITISEFARVLSEKCGKRVSRDVVYQWVNSIRPIPLSYGRPIEEISGGLVTRKDMFPAKWREIWPELDSPEVLAESCSLPSPLENSVGSRAAM